MGRDIKLETMICDTVLVTVTHKAEFTIEPPNNLKSSMKSLLMTGLYSDIILKLTDQGCITKAHKCVLFVRSKPFKELIEGLEETDDYDKSEDGIPIIDLTKQINGNERIRQAFILMINFLYSGEIVFPKDPIDVVEILKLAKDYQIEDLEEICEDDIVKKIEVSNIIQILLISEQDVRVSEETTYRIRSFFLKNFEQIATAFPDIEDRLIKCPGLIKRLFLHISGKKKFKRKVTFVDFDINADINDL